jgi:hypothetical protein
MMSALPRLTQRRSCLGESGWHRRIYPLTKQSMLVRATCKPVLRTFQRFQFERTPHDSTCLYNYGSQTHTNVDKRISTPSRVYRSLGLLESDGQTVRFRKSKQHGRSMRTILWMSIGSKDSLELRRAHSSSIVEILDLLFKFRRHMQPTHLWKRAHDLLLSPAI